MKILLIWIVPIILLLLFWGLPVGVEPDAAGDESEEKDNTILPADDAAVTAENNVPVEYQHHWERRHRNRRII